MKNLLQALVKFNNEVHPIIKGANNPFFKSKFADLATIQMTIKNPLGKNGLVITQANIWTDNQLFVETRIWHSESGENIASVFPVIVNKQAAQDYGSAVSYAKRYSLSGLMNLIIQDEDDDGESAMQQNRQSNTNGTVITSTISAEQLDQLEEELKDRIDIAQQLMRAYQIPSLDQLPKSVFLASIKRVRELKQK